MLKIIKNNLWCTFFLLRSLKKICNTVMLFHPLNTTSWGSLQQEKYPLQAFLSYLNDPATTAQRLKIFLGLGLGPKSQSTVIPTIIKN